MFILRRNEKYQRFYYNFLIFSNTYLLHPQRALYILSGSVLSYKLGYIVGFRLAEMAISTNPEPTIYRNLHENTGDSVITLTVTSSRYCLTVRELGWIDTREDTAVWQNNDQLGAVPPHCTLLQ